LGGRGGSEGGEAIDEDRPLGSNDKSGTVVAEGGGNRFKVPSSAF